MKRQLYVSKNIKSDVCLNRQIGSLQPAFNLGWEEHLMTYVDPFRSTYCVWV